MRGRGAALLIGMKVGQAKAAQQQAAHDAAVQEGAQQAQQQAPAPAPAPAPQASSGGDVTAQLQSLAQLHASGVLSDEEFAAAKKKLLS